MLQSEILHWLCGVPSQRKEHFSTTTCISDVSFRMMNRCLVLPETHQFGALTIKPHSRTVLSVQSWVYECVCVSVSFMLCFRTVDDIYVSASCHVISCEQSAREGRWGWFLSSAPPSWTHERRISASPQFILASVRGWAHRGELWHFDTRRRCFFQHWGCRWSGRGADLCFNETWKDRWLFLTRKCKRGTNGGPRPSQHQKTLLR